MGRTVVAPVHSVNNAIEASTSFSFQVNAREHDHNQTMEEMQQVQDAHQNTLPKQVNDLSLMEEAIKVSMRGVHGNAATKVLESQQTPAKEQSCMISKTSPVNLTDKDKGKAHLHDHANKHNIMHKEQEQVQTNGQSLRFNNQHLQHNTQVWQAKEKQQHPPSRTNVDQTQSGNGYPKVSSNFDHQISSQRNRIVPKPSQPNEKHDQPVTSANKKEHIPEPAPYTVVQTMLPDLGITNP
ncbi:hypothetical protein KY284_030082 [Solanum tuberosum]|nr:hypothetical protein KY284_030082 [Solanum tuberosum]